MELTPRRELSKPVLLLPPFSRERGQTGRAHRGRLSNVAAQAQRLTCTCCYCYCLSDPPPGVPSFYCCLRASPARRSRGPPDLPACAGASATPLRPCSAPCATSTRLDRHGISLREKHRVHLCCCELGIVRSDLGHDTSRPTSLRAYSSSLPSCGAWAGRAGSSFSSCIVVARSVDPGVSHVGCRLLDLERFVRLLERAPLLVV